MKTSNIKKHVARYYKKDGPVKSIEVANNMIGEPNFRVVTFKSGRTINFCLDCNGNWFRNDRTSR